MSTSEVFKHNPTKVSKLLVTKGDVIYTTGKVKVMFPERYINQHIAYMGSVVNVVFITAIIDEDNNYCTSICPAFIPLTPSNISERIIDGINYKVLSFDKNTVFCPDVNLVQSTDQLYNIFDEFFIKGKTPWYIDYINKSDIFLESKKYCNSNIGKSPLAFEILTTVTTRVSQDVKSYYRTGLTGSSKKDILSLPSAIVGLNDIYYGFDNTASKLVGGYYGKGVTAAIVNKEKKTTVMGNILRA